VRIDFVSTSRPAYNLHSRYWAAFRAGSSVVLNLRSNQMDGNNLADEIDRACQGQRHKRGLSSCRIAHVVST
jgi:hypothetical protein